jgi:hypothetical protein
MKNESVNNELKQGKAFSIIVKKIKMTTQKCSSMTGTYVMYTGNNSTVVEIRSVLKYR